MKNKFHPFPILSNDRLILRKTTHSDAEQVLNLRSNPEINKYVKRTKPESKKDASVFIDKISIGIDNGEIVYWSICSKEDNSMLGSICLWKFDNIDNSAEVGYDLDLNYQKQGIMSEALTLILNFAFITLELAQVFAFTRHANESSKNLLVKKGFKLVQNKIDPNNQFNIIYKLTK
jgi:ribosomal-protein-alanine N-acetyltransferase